MRWERALILFVCASTSAVACGESFQAAEPTPDDTENEAGQPSGGTSPGGASGGSVSGGGVSGGGVSGGGVSGGGASPEAGGDAGATTGTAGEGGATTEGPTVCQVTGDCSTGENCVDASCVPALATCGAQKNRYPASKDGVYWVGAGAELHRAYCDMQEVVELCTDTAGEHVGRTRDSSKLQYKMTSVLLPDGTCKMWNMRGAADGYPLWQLEARAGVPAGQTCVKLGFAADGVLGYCSYGESRTNCGYAVKPLHRYGNTCSGCELNEGDFDHWLPQGPIKLSGVLSDASGKNFTTCKTSS